jgi:hypothetical protein
MFTGKPNIKHRTNKKNLRKLRLEANLRRVRIALEVELNKDTNKIEE